MTVLTTNIHFSQGTYTAVQTPVSYDSYGYEYSYRDQPINAHIRTQDGYEVYVDQYYIVLRYKYITVQHSRVTIGMKISFPVDYIDSYKGKERKHIFILRELLNELMQSYTLDGYAIERPIERMVRKFNEQQGK